MTEGGAWTWQARSAKDSAATPRLAQIPEVLRPYEICAGDRGISANTAVRLGLALGIDPQFWLNLQAQYDIEVIQREQGEQLAHEVQALGA